MSDEQRVRDVWPPKPGYFTLRLVRGGWRAPAQILLEDGVWRAVIDGEEYPPSADPVAANVDRVWHYGRFSDAATYRYLNALREWARSNNPSHPAANAKQRINARLLKPIVV